MVQKFQEILPETRDALEALVSESVIEIIRGEGLSEQDGQRLLHEASLGFNAKIQGELQRALEYYSCSTMHSNEVAVCERMHPKSYRGAKPIDEQICQIAELYSLDPKFALEFAKTLSSKSLHESADWFAVPTMWALCDDYGNSAQDFLRQYGEAVRAVIAKFKEINGLVVGPGEVEWIDGYIRLSTTAEKAVETFRSQQEGDIHIIAAQLGMRHRGLSARRVEVCCAQNEYCLDIVSVGPIIQTHPELMSADHALKIFCPGTQVRNYEDVEGNFEMVSYFSSNNGKSILNAAWHDFPCDGEEESEHGSATAFIV